MAPIFTGVARAIGGFGFGAASGPNDPGFMVATYPGSASDSTDGDYRTISWTGSGAFVVTDAPAGANTIELMVLAGGGGGGGSKSGGGGGGGGGARGYRYFAAHPVSALTYPISVGEGGAGRSGARILRRKRASDGRLLQSSLVHLLCS